MPIPLLNSAKFLIDLGNKKNFRRLFMKKLLLFITSIFLLLPLHSQNVKKYEELLAKAKKYEAQKKYAYALGTYFDAAEENLDNADEALDSYYKLLNAFEEGNPGLEAYDEFSLYEGWKSLLEDAERYWTEHAGEVWMFEISNLKRESLDYETKTGSYSFTIKRGENTFKFKQFNYAIKKGLKQVWKNDWKKIPSDWPETSVFPANSTYEKTKAAVYTETMTGLKYYKKKDPSWWCTTFGRFAYPHGVDSGYSTTLYDIKLSIVDLSGKELLNTSRILIKKDSYGGKSYGSEYKFEKVPLNIMTLLDSGEYTIKITNMFLQTGAFIYKSYKDGGLVVDTKWLLQNGFTSYRSFIKNLSEIKVDLSKLNHNSNGFPSLSDYSEKKKIVEYYKFETKKAYDEKNYSRVDELLLEAKAKNINVSSILSITEEEYVKEKHKRPYVEKMIYSFEHCEFSTLESYISAANNLGLDISVEDMGITQDEYNKTKYDYFINEMKLAFSKNGFKALESYMSEANNLGLNLSFESMGITQDEYNKTKYDYYINEMKTAYNIYDFTKVESCISEANNLGLNLSFESLGITEDDYNQAKRKKNLKDHVYALNDSLRNKNYEEARKTYDMLILSGYTDEEIGLDSKTKKKLKIK